ncbi:MAG: hypothetical protein N2170_08660 [Bacteroidia bacterium]|nr:hypothetical protein [Bacteroidia bacterium]
MGVLWICIAWLQYLSPRLIGRAEVQASGDGGLLAGSPTAAFPKQRWAGELSTALYLPAPELGFRLAGASFSWDSLQAVNALIQQWNFDKLSQWETGIGYGLRFLRSRVQLAVRGRLLSTNFSEYGRLHRFTSDIGALWSVSSRVWVGGYGYNLLARGWGLLPGASRFGLGVSYRPTPNAEVSTELVQEGSFPLQLRTAFQYQPHSVLLLRGGIGLPTLLLGVGFTLRYRKVGLDFGYRYQPSLGGWSAIGLSFP